MSTGVLTNIVLLVGYKMKKILTLCFLLAAFYFFLVFPSKILAATLEVPSQYSSIQSAIDTSQDGDTVNVAAGTYNEVIDYKDKAITVSGADKNTTIIDGTGFDKSVVTIVWSNPVWNPEDWSWPTGAAPNQVLENFTIQGGNYQGFGAGIRILNSSPILRHIIVKDNVAYQGQYGSPGWGGGIAVMGSANTVIEDCEISRNQASRGGGIYVDSSDPTVTTCKFFQNNANLGSAITSNGAIGNYNGVVVENNNANYGSAIELVSGNYVLEGVTHAPILFENCLVKNNSGTILAWLWIRPTFRNCEISGNLGWSEGAMRVGANTHLVLDRTTVSNNGAIITTSPSATIYNNSDERQFNDGSITILNSIIWGNTDDFQILPPDVSLDGSYVPAEQFINYSLIQDGYPQGTGNLSADPLFIDSPNGDYHLTQNSPAIDSGDPSSSFDPDGTRADMGSYPFFHQSTPSQQINSLILQVESFNLQQGIENSLDQKLQNAIDSLNAENAGDRQDAINKLQSFVGAVQAQSGNKITVEQANALIQTAQTIITLLSS